jgi:pimeloyl-ACP methyl ester carboxylesterase
VHGAASDARSWALVRGLLRDGLRIAAMDRRGRGLSGKGDDAGHSLDVEADDVLSVAQALGGRVVVAAHSIGATITLEALRRSGDLIAGAVLYEPPHPGAPSWQGQPPHMQAAIREGRYEDALVIFLRDVTRLTAEEVVLFRSSRPWQRAVDLGWTLRREGESVQTLDPDFARYAQISVPVELLVGERTARHLVEATERLNRVLPNSHVTELPGQGHGALVTAPHLVAGAINDFIGRLPEP